MHSRPDSQKSGQSEIFRRHLVDFIDETHEIVKLAQLIDWNMFDRQYDSQYHPDHGAPALPTRRIAWFHFCFSSICSIFRTRNWLLLQ
jgi:IS5 family transposase